MINLIKIIFIIGFLSIVIGLLFGFSVLRMFYNAIFGTRPNPRGTSSNQQKTKQTPKQTNASPAKKIITSDEGEYVDFEEIKDS